MSDACDCFFHEVWSICFNEYIAFKCVWYKKRLYWNMSHLYFGSY